MSSWLKRHSTVEDRKAIRDWNNNQRPRKKKIGGYDRRKRSIALAAFWAKFEVIGGESERLELLRRMAELVFKVASDIGPSRIKKMRGFFDERKNRYYRLSGPCGVCGKPANVRHHIIQIQNGGGNHGLNLIRLCNGCHGAVHPWLRTT